MATTYLTLTNKVLRELNETELTSSTFASSRGIQTAVKDFVNKGINDIYNEGSDEYNIINAIRSYYGALVNYLLTNLTNQFNNAESVPNFPNTIPIVFGGGTSLVKGFMEVVGEQFNQDEFPIEVEKFTLVEDAHTAVARGCLSEAQLIEEEDGETEEKSN